MKNGIRIRLARHGMRNAPVYHIVAIPASKAREARPLEKLGEYDPLPRIRNTDQIPMSNRVFGNEHQEPPKEKTVSWDIGRIKWWLAQGAEPTSTVVKLLAKAGVLDKPIYTTRIARQLRQSLLEGSTPSTLLRAEARRKEGERYDEKILFDAQNKEAEARGVKLDSDLMERLSRAEGEREGKSERASMVEVVSSGGKRTQVDAVTGEPLTTRKGRARPPRRAKKEAVPERSEGIVSA